MSVNPSVLQRKFQIWNPNQETGKGCLQGHSDISWRFLSVATDVADHLHAKYGVTGLQEIEVTWTEGH